jgi:hypothetical protein
MPILETMNSAALTPIYGAKYIYGHGLPADPAVRLRKTRRALAHATDRAGDTRCNECARTVSEGEIVLLAAGRGRHYRCLCESCAAKLLPYERIIERLLVGRTIRAALRQ